ncbi:tyrosine-type recombinase/integrase [Sulfurimonas sp.]|uniref:tyrosine-type recombinase/integrase n=1 Tax=Sulfurimonas sp. TaxID=2022749 RepID=UPI002616CA0E|nr:tyrosine-type recombinase/integrase [Sulfurimonas sp.]MCW8895531.1 tyrosine-type recombinase/integrase [Sulfurimonas sp.]MCW9067991.1 tyrosine-type recombinase/integrase [Sulfurimonas sp.]
MAEKGISTKTLKDGSKHYYVRFMHQGKNYPPKNFTKLYGCRTEKQTFAKLQEIKLLISQGKDPFSSSGSTLNDIFDTRLKQKVENGDWTHSTPKNYSYFYNAYIRKSIGHKKIEKITYDDLLKIQNGMTHVANSTKNTLKMILRPIFVESIKKGVIHKNVVDMLETYNMPVRESLEVRTDEKHLDIVRKLYNAIPKYKALQKTQQEEVRMFLYLTLLTAHRYGELLKLRIEDCYIDKRMIISPKSITKTKEDYKFPIPQELLEYLKKIESGLIFPTIKRGGIYAIFQRLVKLAGIELYNNKRISLHDTRRFMLTIMIRDLDIDSMLADTCLNHKQRGTINHYLSFVYKDIEKAYHQYWELIRNDE